ncbi:MAG TPA: hypothetical protein VFQ13_15215, partial [Anaerolineales bacterium]|nr:hypothetical protein [Anaerolineales bacterium]
WYFQPSALCEVSFDFQGTPRAYVRKPGGTKKTEIRLNNHKASSKQAETIMLAGDGVDVQEFRSTLLRELRTPNSLYKVRQ